MTIAQPLQTAVSLAVVAAEAAYFKAEVENAHEEAVNGGDTSTAMERLKEALRNAGPVQANMASAGDFQKEALNSAVEKGKSFVDAQDKRVEANTDARNASEDSSTATTKTVAAAKCAADTALGTFTRQTVAGEAVTLACLIEHSAARARVDHIRNSS